MAGVLRLRCGCGRIQGLVEQPETGTRAVCYCADCQAFAHFLGAPDRVLDVLGGTDILAIHPRHVHFEGGEDLLANVSLTGRTYRWYASCCRTAVGNTPRDPRIAHVGLVHQCLVPEDSLSGAIGPVRMYVNRQGARAEAPKTSALSFLAAVTRYLVKAAWARLTGTYRQNPFFDPQTGAPRTNPQRLTPDEYASLKESVRAAGGRTGRR